MTLKDNQKFISFIILVLAILVLVFLASTFDRGVASDIVTQGKLRIIDSSIAGLLTIAGMCAQALFKIGESTKIDNTIDEPIPTKPQLETPAEELPPYAR